MIAWNYLHTPEEGSADINIQNLFKNEEGNLYFKLQKTKTGTDFNIDISVLKKESVDNETSLFEEQARVKILLLADDKNFSYIFAAHQSGPKIYLNKKP